MNRPRSFGVRASKWIYRWMLLAFPREYRREWAKPMEQLFGDCAAEAYSRSRYFGLAGLWCRTIGDYLSSLIREFRRRNRRALRPAAIGAIKPMNNFTPRAQQALACAIKEAGRLGHGSVGTEHLLLGILRTEGNVAVAMLKGMGVDPNELQTEIERKIAQSTADSRHGKFPFTPHAKRALALAGREALALGHSYFGCEHMLVGLTLEEGLAQTVLGQFGVDTTRCHIELPKALDATIRKRLSRE